ncbi:MAG: DUF3604 domain-containing protein [Pseudomonadales bacterium]
MIAIVSWLSVALGGCGREQPSPDAQAQMDAAPAAATPAAPASGSAPAVEQNPLRNAYFGDLHLHTALSVDAYITQTRTLPDDAYRYAKGEPIDHVSGTRVQLRTPLDFLAVTDHSELLGVARAMGDPDNPLSKTQLAQDITSSDYERSHNAFRTIVAAAAGGGLADMLDPALVGATMRSTWQQIVDAAEANYEPGRFTTFVAYEWSSMPQMANLHRNVVFRGVDVPDVPFSSADSNKPEDLWSFLDTWRQRGSDVLAIPHNSNASKGLMFPMEDSFGEPLTADYAQRRMRNEPLVEVTQFKGTSETHPALSPNDEMAGFELWETVVGGTAPVEPLPGSYVRSAYGRGLVMEAAAGFNPYRFGLVGASDSHDSSSAVEEFNFTGGHGNADATPELRLADRPSTLTTSNLHFSASGLTGVWAESNTREAIFDAFRRKETFATSGPHISVRFFAGTDVAALADAEAPIAGAYERGVPMGSDLLIDEGEVPEFLIWATRDPAGTNLQRVQVVKVWQEDGSERERVYDVACSGTAVPDPVTGRCPDNGAGVDLATCTPDAGGSAELRTGWRDPEFAGQREAAYYVRVLENPSCRWSTWDALRLGVAPPAGAPATIQERAWSSPIWVSRG